jgi:hypoxanthine phosphoribosyltransferase
MQQATEGGGTAAPEVDGNGDGDKALIERCGVHRVVDGIDAMRKAHRPGQVAGDAVVSIARGKAADATDAVTERGGGRAQVKHGERAKPGAARLQEQRADAADKAAKPGKACAVKQDGGVCEQQRRIFEHVPELGSNDAADGGDGDNTDGVGVDRKAAKVEVQQKARTESGERQHEAEGWQSEVPDMDKRKHSEVPSIDGCGQQTGHEGSMRGPVPSGSSEATAGVPLLQSRETPLTMNARGCMPETTNKAASKDLRGSGSPDTHLDTHAGTRPGTDPDSLPVLYTRQQIHAQVQAIGASISRDFVGEKIVLLGVLKGAAIFLADLARSITLDCTFDFVSVSSYGKGTTSSGQVKLIKDLDESIEGKHVILVEDILDTGLTLSFLRKILLQHHPRSLKLAAFLDKPERRVQPIEADYFGFKIPNHFVVGYGMDFAERYRNLPDIRLFPAEAAPTGH